MATSASTSHYHGIHEMLKAARASTTEPVVAEVSASSSSGDSFTVSSGGSSSGRCHEVSDPRGRVKPSNNKSTKSVSIKQAPSITSPPLGQKQKKKKMSPATSATVPLTKRQKQFLKKRRAIYLFRARERRMIEKFRANACLNLARFQFPKQLPVLVQKQMEQQHQQQINQESPNEDADSDGPQDRKPAATTKSPPPPPPPARKRHRREASTMDTLVGVATAILDAQEQEHPNIEFK